MSTGITTDYASNFVYENNTLQFFNQPEGYVEPIGSGSYNYVYQYKDHLGNIRLSYSDKNNNGVILVSTDPNTNELVEENNYYPFGLKHKGYNNVQMGRDHKFGFGNKEEQDELGLAWIDITARNYDPALGRWMNVDPMAEKFNPISPYVFVLNNPIIYTDPDGKDVILNIKGESLKGYQKFASTKAGEAFLRQFVKAGDKIPGTNIPVKESGKYANETLTFQLEEVTKGNVQTFIKNKNGSNKSLNEIYGERSLKNWSGNYFLNVNLDDSDSMKADEYAVIIGHESFVHVVSLTKDIDKIRDNAKNGKYKSILDYINDIISLGDEKKSDRDHIKLTKDEIKLFFQMIKELDKKEKTNKYTEMYEKNKKDNE